jgi:Bacterial Ig-like domain (group 2)
MSMITFGQRLAAVVAASLLLLSVVGAPPAAARAPSWSHRDAHVCGQPGAGQARCTSVARAFYLDGREYQARTESELATAAAATQTTWFHGPDLRTAYGITAQGDPSKVVAIVDAYDDPNAFSNLTRFRTDQGLPAIQSCSLATLTSLTSSASNPCFTKVNQTGGTSLPSADSGWSNEIDLDLQAASSICPTCSILLLEATSASLGNLATAVTTAAGTAHVLAISNSYGISGDYPGSLAPAYDNAARTGLAVTASAGDGGYGILFPASATNVIGVGGTTLFVSGTTGVRTSETVWSGTGSGCSVYNAAPAWQSIPGNPCAGKKAVSDLSADADPNSGLAIYTTYSGITGYWVFGGTSLSSPLIAALYTTQGGYGGSTLAGQYAWAAGTPYYDVTSGSNGTCSPSVLCTAGTGWDGPTGRGSIAATTAPPVLTTITVSPSSASVTTGGTQQFSATGKDQYGQPMSPQPTFTWSVSSGGTISSSGLFTAGSTTGGPFTVTATSGSVSGTASVTVTAPPVLTTITVSPATASVQTGKTQQFTASGLDQFGQPLSSQPTFTWSLPDGGGTISSSGLFTAGSTPGGPFTVTASSGGVSGTASVTVTSPPPDFSLSVNPTSQSIRRGGTATYTVIITLSNGFNGSVTLSLSGQPSGSTVTFTPNPATGTSTLTIKTRSSTSQRTYTLTIKGVNGSLSHSTSASLTVTR